MKSRNTYLSFYSDIIILNGISSVKSTSTVNSTLYSEGYRYLPEYDYHMKEDMINEDSSMPTFFTEIITKEEFFEKLLNFENKAIYKNIEAEISLVPLKESIAYYLSGVYDELETLLKALRRKDDSEVVLVEKKLLELLKLLKERYAHLVGYHSIFRYLKKETSSSYFKDKDMKRAFYVDLYEMAYSLNLIDDEEIDEEDFIDAFTFPNPQLLSNKIKFTCNNNLLSYFLQSLKPFFSELTNAKIEQSKIFINKQSKLVTSNDIEASLSRGKDKNATEKIKIDQFVSKLKKHLK